MLTNEQINKLDFRYALTVEHYHKLTKDSYTIEAAFDDACFKYGLDVDEMVELRDIYHSLTGVYINI